jgi:hypothetical protein
LKRNTALLWSLFAENYAGNISEQLFSDKIREILYQNLTGSLDNSQSNSVKLASLVAIETFCLSGFESSRKWF